MSSASQGIQRMRSGLCVGVVLAKVNGFWSLVESHRRNADQAEAVLWVVVGRRMPHERMLPPPGPDTKVLLRKLDADDDVVFYPVVAYGQLPVRVVRWKADAVNPIVLCQVDPGMKLKPGVRPKTSQEWFDNGWHAIEQMTYGKYIPVEELTLTRGPAFGYPG